MLRRQRCSIPADHLPVSTKVYRSQWLLTNPLFFVQRYSEYCEIFVFVFVIGLYHIWVFLSAWQAPAGPKIYQDIFSLKRTKRDRFSIYIRQRKFRGLFVYPLRFINWLRFLFCKSKLPLVHLFYLRHALVRRKFCHDTFNNAW